MNYLADNCIIKQQVPSRAGCAGSFDYNSDLDLYATLERDDEMIYVWDRRTLQVVAEFESGLCDLVFLPGGYLAASLGNARYGFSVRIYSLASKSEVLQVENDEEPVMCQLPGVLAVTPGNSLLAADMFDHHISQIDIDFKNMEFISKDIIKRSYGGGIQCLCCCKHHYTIYYSQLDECNITCVNVEFSENAQAKATSKEVIKLTHCFIDGEKREFGNIFDLAHDGDSLLVATERDIILLESATEGSAAKVIVSKGIFGDEGQIKINRKGQLMVCDGSDVISVYEYKRPINCLQGLCRQLINGLLRQTTGHVNDLPISANMKDYLINIF